MKRSILFSLLILILLTPLIANTEDNSILVEIESPPIAIEEEPITITEEPKKDNTPLEIDAPPILASAEPDPIKEAVIIPAGNTTVAGVNGYLVLPSAEPVPSENGISITTGYSAIFSSDVYAHVPFVQMGFSDIAEVSLAFDIATKTDILLNAKWRFSHRKETSLALGVVGQLIDVGTAKKLAAQLYVASTFSSSIMDFPSKTTVLLGYTFHKDLNTNIDFGIAFSTPLLANAFKEKVFLLLDFGNVSYSISPSAGDAQDRGLVNLGIRLLPIKVLDSIYLAADLRALDLFDHKGRALSLAISLSFRPS
ncbi:MAG TPA: hypothetical protein VJ869_04520 [Sphaerochaeta sp.]|nr:hypothetical protein [Sphaerochaeta sp.]